MRDYLPIGTAVQPIHALPRASVLLGGASKLGFPLLLTKQVELEPSQVFDLPDSLRGSDSIKVAPPYKYYQFKRPIDDPKNILFARHVAHGFLFCVIDVVILL